MKLKLNYKKMATCLKILFIIARRFKNHLKFNYFGKLKYLEMSKTEICRLAHYEIYDRSRAYFGANSLENGLYVIAKIIKPNCNF